MFKVYVLDNSSHGQWLFDTAAILTQHSKTGVLRDVN